MGSCNFPSATVCGDLSFLPSFKDKIFDNLLFNHAQFEKRTRESKIVANLGAKGAKRSAIKSALNFHNILFNANSRPPQIRSLHTYEVVWMFYFGWITWICSQGFENRQANNVFVQQNNLKFNARASPF